MSIFNRVVVIAACMVLPAAAQKPEVEAEALSARVLKVLKTFDIATHCDLKPEVTGKKPRVQVQFLKLPGFRAADLVRVFTLMTSDEVGLELSSLDMGRPDKGTSQSLWRPRSFSVVASKPPSANRRAIALRLASITQAIRQLDDAMGEATITNLSFGNHDAQLSMKIPKGTPKLASRAERVLTELGGVLSTSHRLTRAKNGGMTHTWTVAFTPPNSESPKPATRMDIGLKVLKTAQEFEVHDRLSIRGMLNHSRPLNLALKMERPRKLRDIIEIATAIEKCHRGLRITSMIAKIDSLSKDLWTLPTLEIQPESPDFPAEPSCLKNFASTARALSSLVQRHKDLTIRWMQIRKREIDFSLYSSSSTLDWITDAQQSLAALTDVAALKVGNITTSTEGSQLEGITVVFADANSDLKKRFRAAMLKTKAKVLSASQDSKSIMFRLRIDASRTTGLLERLLDQVPNLAAKSMKVLSAETKDGHTTLMVSYQLR